MDRENCVASGGRAQVQQGGAPVPLAQNVTVVPEHLPGPLCVLGLDCHFGAHESPLLDLLSFC